MGPADDPDVAERIAVVQDNGTLCWLDGERVDKVVGFPAGARLILSTPNEHHEITGVILQRPSLPKVTSSQQRWRLAMFKRRELIERRLPKAWEALEKADRVPGLGVSVTALKRVEELEREGAEYNEMAQELALPLLRIELRGWAEE